MAEKTELGKTGLSIHPIGLGANKIGHENPETNTEYGSNIVTAAVENGLKKAGFYPVDCYFVAPVDLVVSAVPVGFAGLDSACLCYYRLGFPCILPIMPNLEALDFSKSPIHSVFYC